MRWTAGIFSDPAKLIYRVRKISINEWESLSDTGPVRIVLCTFTYHFAKVFSHFKCLKPHKNLLGKFLDNSTRRF